MEIINQIAAWGFGQNKKENASIYSNAGSASLLGTSLQQEAEFYRLWLIKYDQQRSNAQMALYIQMLYIVLAVLITVYILLGKSK